ncbi:MAG TPA: hypothetical protein VFQ51_19285 [Vicinamibacteria bacterium]|nr:hypothetical protein [Vicinamibacteria bacterium]
MRMVASHHAETIRRALDGAYERLGRPECRKLFTDFVDLEGRPLQQRLDGLNLDGQQFLRFVGFYEGYGHKRCERASVMAFTQPGSLAVRVCPQIAKGDREIVELILIHEMLHSLGLGENPPSTFEITRQVMRRCGGGDKSATVRTATR